MMRIVSIVAMAIELLSNLCHGFRVTISVNEPTLILNLVSY